MSLASLVPAAGRPAAPREASGAAAGRAGAAAQLAADVHAIASSSGISRATREKRIATTVRVAVIAATAYKLDPQQVLGLALDLAEAAAQAAPSYAEVITNAVSFAAPVARITGAAGQIRSAAFAAARNPHAPRVARAAPARRPAAPAAAEAEPAEANPAPDTGVAPAEPAMNPPAAETADDAAPPAGRRAKPKFEVDSDRNLKVSVAGAVQYDDNVFLTADKVHDTILSLTPGAEVHFGQQSLAHGELAYHETFLRYSDHSAPNVNLGLANADFGFSDEAMTLALVGSYQQLYQNDQSTAALGLKQIFRRDQTDVSASFESHLTAKTSARVAGVLDQTEYKTSRLIGSRDLSLPVSFYYLTTPKLSLSAGGEYRSVTPQGNGPVGHDTYYNLGARGEFTAKLSGEISVGYRTRSVASNPPEHILGFNGNLNYEISPKSNATLLLARDFSTGALGESAKNNSYTLRFSTDPTPQWQIAASLGYRNVQYGPTVFVSGHQTNSNRRDNYWEGSLAATYLFSASLSASAGYTFRNNGSTLPELEFSDNQLSLTLGWTY